LGGNLCGCEGYVRIGKACVGVAHHLRRRRRAPRRGLRVDHIVDFGFDVVIGSGTARVLLRNRIGQKGVV
jgi:hypothetical protein